MKRIMISQGNYIMLHYQNYITLIELLYINCTSIHLKFALLNGVICSYYFYFTLWEMCKLVKLHYVMILLYISSIELQKKTVCNWN